MMACYVDSYLYRATFFQSAGSIAHQKGGWTGGKCEPHNGVEKSLPCESDSHDAGVVYSGHVLDLTTDMCLCGQPWGQGHLQGSLGMLHGKWKPKETGS
jgi:hypothetical protein